MDEPGNISPSELIVEVVEVKMEVGKESAFMFGLMTVIAGEPVAQSVATPPSQL
jgi:hypothetical protein